MIIRKTKRLRLAPAALTGALALAGLMAGCADRDADEHAAAMPAGEMKEAPAMPAGDMHGAAEKAAPRADSAASAPAGGNAGAPAAADAAGAMKAKAEAATTPAAKAQAKPVAEAASAGQSAAASAAGKAKETLAGKPSAAPKPQAQTKPRQTVKEAKAKADQAVQKARQATQAANKPASGASAPAASAAAATVASSSAWAVGDAAKGARIGRKCLSCHNTNARRKVGPGLAGVFGRHVGRMPDMKYSPALANGDWRWDEAHLAAWVCNSKEAVRKFSGDASAGTKMPSQRVCDPAKQADLIAWLKTLK